LQTQVTADVLKELEGVEQRIAEKRLEVQVRSSVAWNPAASRAEGANTVSEEEGDTVDCGGMKARIAAALDQGKDLSCILKRITYH
jgi:hypothetical protein